MKFEEIICKIFNEIEATDSYVVRDVKQGFQIFSPQTNTAVKCIGAAIDNLEEAKVSRLFVDVKESLELIKNNYLGVQKLVIVSALPDDDVFTELFAILTSQKNDNLKLEFWNWNKVVIHLTEFKHLFSDKPKVNFAKFVTHVPTCKTT